jgi:hypothetical protein
VLPAILVSKVLALPVELKYQAIKIETYMTFTKYSVLCLITENCSRHRAVTDKAEWKNDKAGPTWFRPGLHLAWLLVFLLTCFGGAFRSSAFYMETALPLYIYPSSGQPDWAAAINAGGGQVGFIIANVNNGPGSDVQPEWASVINSAAAAGIAIYGYVYTQYGARDSATVEADIARWFSLYPNVTGIFLDETASEPAQLPYYQARYGYIKSLNPGFQVVINPGTITDEGYMNACDVNTIFESDYSSWLNLTLPAWISNYGEDRFYAIVYSVGTQSMMENVVGTAKGRNFGKIFVTDAATPSTSLPGYFQAELTAIASQRDESIALAITSYGVSGITARSATISWTTSVASVGHVAFGTSPDNLTTVVTDPDPAATHSLSLTGLNRKTTYYYVVTAFSVDGNSAVSTPVSSFKTRVH